MQPGARISGGAARPDAPRTWQEPRPARRAAAASEQPSRGCLLSGSRGHSGSGSARLCTTRTASYPDVCCHVAAIVTSWPPCTPPLPPPQVQRHRRGAERERHPARELPGLGRPGPVRHRHAPGAAASGTAQGAPAAGGLVPSPAPLHRAWRVACCLARPSSPVACWDPERALGARAVRCTSRDEAGGAAGTGGDALRKSPSVLYRPRRSPSQLAGGRRRRATGSSKAALAPFLPPTRRAATHPTPRYAVLRLLDHWRAQACPWVQLVLLQQLFFKPKAHGPRTAREPTERLNPPGWRRAGRVARSVIARTCFQACLLGVIAHKLDPTSP